jgi:putative endonuclease
MVGTLVKIVRDFILKKIRIKEQKKESLGIEVLAAQFLMKQGYSIKDRNYLRKYGEIDIVAVRDKTYHFVEVKTVSCYSLKTVLRQEMGESVAGTGKRRSFDQYRPEDNVHPWKLRRLSRVIQAYLLDKRLLDVDWSFDLITVYIDKQTGESALRLIEDIVL